MQRAGWSKTLGIGLLIGLVDSIFMTLAMMVLCYGLGITTGVKEVLLHAADGYGYRRA
jgi:hypothetical protein